jgi:hypothetical protein
MDTTAWDDGPFLPLVVTLTPHIIRIPDVTEEDVTPVYVGTDANISYQGTPRVENPSGDRGPFDFQVGIAPADLPKVLELFFTTKLEGQGTGPGLPICRRIVQEHHGTFNIGSDVGQGTTVRIVLPITDRTNSAHLQGAEL